MASLVVGPGLTGEGTPSSPLMLASASTAPSSNGVYPAGPRPTGLWTRLTSSAVLVGGGTGAWDSGGVYGGTVLKVGNTFRMYYSGQDASGWAGIGIATSPDGITWTKHAGNPVLPRGASGQWDSAATYYASVVYDGSTYYLFYNGSDSGGVGRIGLATSSDGINFTRSGSNPVLAPEGSGFESRYVSYANVLLEGGVFTMWYAGLDGASSWSIGRATSPDGTHWTRDSTNPVLVVSSAWEETHVFFPAVIKAGRMHYMHYIAGGSTNQRAGLATSWDGRTWTRAPFNPVLDVQPNSFQAISVGAGGLLIDDGRIWWWYSGHDGSRWSVGVAAQELL